jgi:hypothetical protein
MPRRSPDRGAWRGSGISRSRRAARTRPLELRHAHAPRLPRRSGATELHVVDPRAGRVDGRPRHGEPLAHACAPRCDPHRHRHPSAQERVRRAGERIDPGGLERERDARPARSDRSGVVEAQTRAVGRRVVRRSLEIEHDRPAATERDRRRPEPPVNDGDVRDRRRRGDGRRDGDRSYRGRRPGTDDRCSHEDRGQRQRDPSHAPGYRPEPQRDWSPALP